MKITVNIKFDSTNENIHRKAIEEVEIPLFKAAMERCRYNQFRAAKFLGISRGTLRTKLKSYFGDQYFGSSRSDV